jgi:DNA-binding NarL/FixJ family response regulator
MSFEDSEVSPFVHATTTPTPNGWLALRDCAIAADAAANERVDLAEIWQALVGGTMTVVHDFFTQERCGLVLAATAHLPNEPLMGRRLLVLEAILRGSCQKRIAIELDFAPSTVATDARSALTRLGVKCRPSRVHPLLMLAATSAQATAGVVWADRCRLPTSTGGLMVIGIPRPDRSLEPLLPRAELDVVRHLVEGDCYEKISSDRGTSSRTIANQIAAVFRRLKVSGRSELLQQLFAFGAASADVDVPGGTVQQRA